MRFLLKIFKGLLIGVSVVIPGVSGGTMAVSMGIYDQVIDFVTARKSARRHGVTLMPYAIGIVIGVAIFAYFIEKMFLLFPLQTAFLFVGMIVSGVPELSKKLHGQSFRWTHALILLATTVIMTLLPIASRNAGAALTLQPGWLHALLAILLGAIAAATLIVPGISGSMMLMVLGYYEPILGYVNHFTAALFRLDWAVMADSLAILLPFGIGVVFGCVIMARLIRYLLNKFPYSTYYAIIGLVIASPFTILYQQSFAEMSLAVGTVCLVLMFIGFFSAMLLGKGDRHANL